MIHESREDLMQALAREDRAPSRAEAAFLAEEITHGEYTRRVGIAMRMKGQKKSSEHKARIAKGMKGNTNKKGKMKRRPNEGEPV